MLIEHTLKLGRTRFDSGDTIINDWPDTVLSILSDNGDKVAYI